jgi:hypothetical protein
MYKEFYKRVRNIMNYKSNSDSWTEFYSDVCDYVPEDDYECPCCGYKGMPVVMCDGKCKCCNDVVDKGEEFVAPADKERLCPFCDYHGWEEVARCINSELDSMEIKGEDE